MEKPICVPPSLLLFELNEASHSLLRAAASTKKFPGIEKFLGFTETLTVSTDADESGYLEPWAQWVSIHTGVPAQNHGIKHLGDVANLKHKQLWEILGESNITSGIWGIMNGSRQGEKNCLFFLSDPWTSQEQAYPEQADQLSVLARYISQNYLNLSAKPFISAAFSYGRRLLQILSFDELISAATILLEGLLLFGPTKLVLGAFFEYTSACAFLKFKKNYNPRFSILFLNLLAHAQHHYWTKPAALSPELCYSFKVVDLIVQKVLNTIPASEILLVANGLGQISTEKEEPWVLYRQKDHAHFLKKIGIAAIKVEPLMTNDALVYFDNTENCNRAFSMLSNATIHNEKLFFVERDALNACKLFYRLQFTKNIDDQAVFSIEGTRYKFFDCFQKIVTRTGRHSQEGFVFQTKSIMPPKIQNYELAHYILSFFDAQQDSQCLATAFN